MVGRRRAGLSASRGRPAGVRFFQLLLRVGGLNRACECVWVVGAYYATFDRKARSAAMPYIRRRFSGSGSLGWSWRAYRLLVSQGQALLEGVAMRHGLEFACDFENAAAVEDLSREEGAGVVLLTSHFGCWQAMVSELGNFRRRVNLLVAPERNEEVKRALAVDGESGLRIGVISNLETAGGMVEVAAALDRGEVVCMMGDRCIEEEGVEVTFLGEMARFPVAAFHVASMVGCRVVPVFMVRDGSHRKFRIRYGDPIAPKRVGRADRREALAESVREYVAELEEMTNRYPYQCFLLDDVWRRG